MKKFYLSLLTACLLCAGTSVFSQFNYQAANGVITSGTYTDLGATGTAITTADFDDANSAAQPIGFTFNYNGANFTEFFLNTNGFIKLGAAPAAANIYNPISSAETNLIYPLAADLDGDAGSNSEYRVFTSGAVGSRVTTIQFKNVRDWNPTAGGGQFASMNFQIKLFEGTNNIEFVYGTFTPTATPAAFIEMHTGVKGSTAAASLNLTKASATAWGSATFLEGNYTGNKFNIRNNVLPTAGQTYRFVAVSLPPNDAQVQAVFTLSKIPVGFGGGHVIRAVVRNAGSAPLSNVNVTLNVTGANTFSNVQNIASLAVGASTTVSFAAFTPTTAGTNTVTVTVPNDDLNTNNSASQTQEVTTGTMSYATADPSSSSLGYGTGSGIIAVRYRMNGTGFVNNVGVFLSASSGTNFVTGQTVYAVVLNSAGTIVGQSANYVIIASEQNAWKQFQITTPVSFTNEDFFVGLAQTANAAIGTYFPVGTQTETPTRTDAYFTAPLAGGAAPTAQTTFGRFMIETTLGATFPVTFMSFTGRTEGTVNTLNWVTASEINNKAFELQRSADGRNFTTIATIASKAEGGNSNSQLNYSYNDERPLAGTNFYRLKQVDNDGRFSFSDIVSLRSTVRDIRISSVYPNPTRDNLTIIITSPATERANVMITDLSGKVITQRALNLMAGDNMQTINVQSLASGTYLIKLICNNGCEAGVQRFVKQ